ncbi:glycosyltransferase family 2 protein [Mucilaginibacter sp. HMF5004]|uniref:glycosyltransferase family 2 protein n=1 Tax=Mucilaginibacter rivuli TaxID=2857527 RepID=UPI001C5E6FA1|nr:glycosyltransferase [Mucilaginibacter rivuli]MBW4889825.1 glycosyltransferase family 2 protein [Mucilaginibacter rivuli]
MEGHTFAITVYKESAYLEQCIQSIVNQTVKTNVIIVTSTPTEFSRDLAGQYNIPYHVNDTDIKNAATNWNFAIQKAETKLVTVVHQDDLYQPSFAENVVNKFNQYQDENVLISFTGYIDMVNDKMRKVSASALVKQMLLMPFLLSKVIKSRFLKRLVLMFGNPVCCPSVTFNKNAIGDFSFSTKYLIVLDWFAWYELAKKEGSFLFINKKLIIRRIHTDSHTTAFSNSGAAKNDEQRFFEEMWGSKLIAKLLIRVYQLGHLDNKI